MSPTLQLWPLLGDGKWGPRSGPPECIATNATYAQAWRRGGGTKRVTDPSSARPLVLLFIYPLTCWLRVDRFSAQMQSCTCPEIRAKLPNHSELSFPRLHNGVNNSNYLTGS